MRSRPLKVNLRERGNDSRQKAGVFTRLQRGPFSSSLNRMSAQALPNLSATNSELKVVIICEDLESGKYAKGLQDQLLTSLGANVSFSPEAWTFRALQHPELQDLARKEITEADLILVSTRSDEELPKAIKDWLEIGLTETDRPRALAALFGKKSNPHHVAATNRYLQEVAVKGHLEFFAEQSCAVQP